ncbi:hypothetical protein OEZ85_012046 [Tetradesmus obliquus]|uniref:PHD-type domain-containing protein n=1 Tax=Tetradesmus obliquus TaxID=3088 RepID=A0ABY8TS73_TETOB|nr:hypothetical protein OEZ85_012046 [Tetradesmus obliquus]
MSGSQQQKMCAFCGGDAAAHGGRLGRMQGPYNASRSGYEAVYVHHECAVWSPKTSQDEKLRLRSVGTEVRRARNLRCTICNRSGAALGCRLPSCNRCFHLPCAIEAGASFNFELYLMACPEHAALFKKETTGRAAERSGPLAHLKLAGQPRHRQPTHLGLAAAAAAAAPAPRGSKAAKRKRNTMTAAQLGEHIDAAKAAYKSLADELQAAHDASEPDEAVIFKKDAKRLRKAVQQLAPTLLRPPPQALPSQQQQQQRWQPPAGGFANVGGLADVKRQLREMVLLPLAHPQLMQQLGIQPPRGILLHGPPGTGKTAIVRALAAECAAAGWGSSGSSSSKPVALFARKGTDCLGKYAGDAELHLRLLFDMAAAAAPSIIFLDELDGLVPPRSVRASSSDQIFASVVSVLLALLDGLKDRGQVLVIGATNRPDAIDPALRRPGRFDREVYFNLPSQQDRSTILAVHTARWSPQPTQELLQQLAAATDGWAGEGDISRGLVAGVKEAVARTGRGQLLVLYLPRIEVGGVVLL